MPIATCGVDWAQDHHDIAIVDTDGRLLAKRRILESIAGFTELADMLAEAGDDPDDPIPVAIETPRGLLVAVLRASGRPVYPINPMSVARYRERTSMSGKKSDHGDAVTLANILRTDADQHRRLPADTELAQSITVLARAHQDATWRRTRASNELRSLLREYFPAFLHTFADRPGGISTPEARAVLAIAETPAKAARLTKPQIVAALRRSGRHRGLTSLAATIQQRLRTPQLRHPSLVEDAFGVQAAAVLATLDSECASVERLGEATAAAFAQHPDHQIITSFVGFADLTGARLLAEIGDDRTRFADARALIEGVRRVRAGDQSLWAQYPNHPPAREEQPSCRGRICLGIRRLRLPGPHSRSLPGPPRPRRPPRRSAAPPLQQDARTALPLPANRPNLRPDPGLPHTLYAFRTRCRLTLNKIGGLWGHQTPRQLQDGPLGSELS